MLFKQWSPIGSDIPPESVYLLVRTFLLSLLPKHVIIICFMEELE